MDYRPYILAGTFLLLLVAMVTFVAAVMRSRRQPDHHGHAAQHEPAASLTANPVDTNLDGLEVIVEADAPSASLLTPLRESEWVPPEEPARLSDLPDVSLASRIERYEPAPSVPEPAFAKQEYQSWEVGAIIESLTEESAQPEQASAPADEPLPSPERPPVPDVGEAPLADSWMGAEISAVPDEPASWPAALPETPQPTQHDDEAFSAEIAALLPGLDHEETVSPATVAETHEPEAGAGTLPPGPDHQSPHQPVVHDEQAPAAAPTAVPAAPTPVETWASLAFESGAVAPRAEAVARVPSAERPAVTIGAGPLTEPIDHGPASEPPVEPSAPRPVVRVNPQPSGPGASALSGPSVTPVAGVPGLTDSRDQALAADIRLASPVEMWFGEHRVGVKAGSATYDRFMKYAGELFDDLKEATGSAR